jgi:hypothetical protein
MTTTPSEFSSADLLVLQRQLEDWRSRQYGRPRIPSAVWEAAAALGHAQGASRIARILGLSYPGLLAWMRRVPSASSARLPKGHGEPHLLGVPTNVEDSGFQTS